MNTRIELSDLIMYLVDTGAYYKSMKKKHPNSGDILFYSGCLSMCIAILTRYVGFDNRDAIVKAINTYQAVKYPA